MIPSADASTRRGRAASDKPLAIHATAVAIDGLALLIRGPSKAGKSTLALDLVARSRADRPIMLVGDDRVLLTWRGDDLVVAPHPRIAGMIEKRGHGILSMPFCTAAPIAGIVDLAVGHETAEASSYVTTCDLLGENFPSLVFVNERKWLGRCAAVLAWLAATSSAHCREKVPRRSS